MSVKFSDKGIAIENKFYKYFRDIPKFLLETLDGKQKDLIKLYFDI